MDLLGMIKGQLTDAVVGQLGKAVNLNPEDVTKAMNVIVPTQVSALIQHGSTPQGAQGLLGLLGNFGNLGDFSKLIGAVGGAGSLLKIGEAVLPALFGGKLSGVLSGLASHTGLNQGALGSLMNLAGPLILGQLGGLVKSNGLNASGLGSLLGGLQGAVNGLLPGGLSSAVNLGSAAGALGAIPNLGGLMQGLTGLVGGAAAPVANVANTASQLGSAAVTAASQVAEPRKAGMPLWLPLLGVAAIAVAGWFLLKPGASSSTPTTTTPPAVTDTTTPPATDSTTAAVVCDKAYSLNVTDGATVNEPFQFGGTGKGKGYNITVYQDSDGRKIGTKDLPNDKDCNWGYTSNPTKGKIKYEVREIGGTDILSTVTLDVK